MLLWKRFKELVGEYLEVIGSFRVTPKAFDAASVSVNVRDHAGKVIVLNRAAGQAVRLPDARGTGAVFTFFLQTTITSNTTTIKVANTTDVMLGSAIVCQDAGDTVVGFETVTTDDTVTLNGTTTGGIKGDMVVLTDVAKGIWHVNARTSATGTEATPFSATV